MIGNAIFSLLDSDGTLDAIVGSRIYPTAATQTSSLPDNYIVYTLISSQPKDTKTGISNLDFVRIQVECYSKDRDEAVTMYERVRTILDRYEGTAASIDIESIQYQTVLEDYVWEYERYIVASDYIIQEKR